MAGFENTIVFSQGEKLQTSTSDDILRMQSDATDVARINGTGSPIGVVSANPSSLYHDNASGNVYFKQSGTGNTGWSLVGSVSSGAGTQYHIPRYADSTGQIFQDSGWQVNAAGQLVGTNIGVPSAPDFCLKNDTNGLKTGYYQTGTGQWGFSSAGTEAGIFDSIAFQWNGQVRSYVTDANVSSASITFIAQHLLSGGNVGADGIGTRWRTNLPDDGGNMRTAADMIMEYQEAATATRKGRFRFFADLAGTLTEVFNAGLYQAQFFKGMAYAYFASATSVVATPSQFLIAITNTSAARTVLLPAPGATGMVVGQCFEIKDESLACSVNNITVSATSATIEGQASIAMNINGQTLKVYSNGTNYFIK